MKTCLVAVVVLLAVTVKSDAAKLPTNWKTCKRSDPNFQACLMKTIQPVIEELARKGKPNLGIYPLDPMQVNKLRLNSGAGSVALDLTFSNMKIYGFKDIRVDKIEADSNVSRLKFKVTILSPLTLIGDYSVKGRLLVVPVVGTGKCNITLGEPVAANGIITTELRKGEDGRTFLYAKDFGFDFSSKNVKLMFHDNAHGDNQLGATLNRIVNDNSADILRDLQPAISDAFGQAFQDITNRVFMKVPFDELFPK